MLLSSPGPAVPPPLGVPQARKHMQVSESAALAPAQDLPSGPTTSQDKQALRPHRGLPSLGASEGQPGPGRTMSPPSPGPQEPAWRLYPVAFLAAHLVPGALSPAKCAKGPSPATPPGPHSAEALAGQGYQSGLRGLEPAQPFSKLNLSTAAEALPLQLG